MRYCSHLETCVVGSVYFADIAIPTSRFIDDRRKTPPEFSQSLGYFRRPDTQLSSASHPGRSTDRQAHITLVVKDGQNQYLVMLRGEAFSVVFGNAEKLGEGTDREFLYLLFIHLLKRIADQFNKNHATKLLCLVTSATAESTIKCRGQKNSELHEVRVPANVMNGVARYSLPIARTLISGNTACAIIGAIATTPAIFDLDPLFRPAQSSLRKRSSRSSARLPTQTPLGNRVRLRDRSVRSGCWVFEGPRFGTYSVRRRERAVGQAPHVIAWLAGMVDIIAFGQARNEAVKENSLRILCLGGVPTLPATFALLPSGKSSPLTRRHITVLQQRSKDPSTVFYPHTLNTRSTDSLEILSSHPRLQAPLAFINHLRLADTSDKLHTLQFSRQEVAERMEDHAFREAFLRASCEVFSKAGQLPVAYRCKTRACPLASQATQLAILDAIAIAMALSDPIVVLTLLLLKLDVTLAAQAHSLFTLLQLSRSDLGWTACTHAWQHGHADTTGIRPRTQYDLAG
ncbi:hypothetical protein H4582DRAFT_2062834 [Lactarius indigo]|nr:hypothetical protein H4582DRAFT_2062834 [Lactarius indigo]